MPLGKDADAGDYVKDFQKSDAPQFKGKSKDKRRKMAVAAFLAQRRSKKEEKNCGCGQTPCKTHGVKESTDLNEEMMFKVSIENLPDMVMIGRSPSEVKSALRKIVKQPSMITGVQRMTKAQVKKRWRDMAMSGDPEQNVKDKGGD
jgi:hypothetical protein|tara:strand:+ start:5302 stop:5739 length:438 start_codon:yes stop_codon:yes gene_type:complete